MELFAISHIPTPIMGAILFVLGTALVGLIRDIENGPAPSRWLRHDMSALLASTVLTVPISLGLGLMMAGVISFVMSYGASLTELVLMAAIVIVGSWLGRGRATIMTRPAEAT